MAHRIREAVDRTYVAGSVPATRTELWQRARAAVRCGHGDGASVSDDHDQYLEESFAS
jgi:hypothetical protein